LQAIVLHLKFMKFLKRILVLSLVLLPLLAAAQQAAAPPSGKTPASSRAQHKEAKRKWKEQRKLERDNRKAIEEHHKRLQTKNTLKRMKKNHNKGERMRENRKEFFLVRWFKYKRKKV
jgi:Ni/Co efflux regulator RcnB